MARLEGRNMTMVLAPEKKAVAKKPHEPRGCGARRAGLEAAADATQPAEQIGAGSGSTRSSSHRSSRSSRSTAGTGRTGRGSGRRNGRPGLITLIDPNSQESTMPKMKTSKTAAKRFRRPAPASSGACSRTASTCSRRSRRRAPAASTAWSACTPAMPRRSSACSASADPENDPRSSDEETVKWLE